MRFVCVSPMLPHTTERLHFAAVVSEFASTAMMSFGPLSRRNNAACLFGILFFNILDLYLSTICHLIIDKVDFTFTSTSIFH